MLNFDKKMVFITGATGGIGRATAIKLANLGADLVLTDMNLDALSQLRNELSDTGAYIKVSVLDVADEQRCADFLAGLCEQGHFGIDVLIHCAGIYPEVMVKDMTATQWQELMQVNLNGTFNICKSVMPYLNEDSAIVNLSSVAGHKGSYAHAHYSASKGAVTSFSKSLGLELAPKTRVNCVAPGIIKTAMTDNLVKGQGDLLLKSTPLKRFGNPEEIADVIVFLSSSMSSFITCETIHVNGGLYVV